MDAACRSAEAGQLCVMGTGFPDYFFTACAGEQSQVPVLAAAARELVQKIAGFLDLAHEDFRVFPQMGMQ